MARWEPFNAVGGAYSDDARPWSVQDTVNYLVVQAERGGTRSPAILRGVPGFAVFCGDLPEAPVRGIYVAEGRLFAVVGNGLYQISASGTSTLRGTIPGVGRCTFAHNQVTGGNQVVIANGQTGYVWNTVTETLTQITDEGFPGFRSVDFADQYIIGVEPFGRYWFHSDLSDALSYNTLDRYQAEKSPDRIQQAIQTGSDVLVLGERTSQFYYNTGAATGTWANRQGAELDRGAASPFTACRIDNTVIWLGDDGSVYRLNGYTAQRISTHALEQAISRSTLADAFAFTFEDRGHKCYLLTFPDGRTWCFDVATGEWTRRQSYTIDRWRVNCLAKWGNAWIGGDYTNGFVYQLDWALQTENGEVLERRRTFPVLHDEQNKLIVSGLELVFDTGMDEASAPLPVVQIPLPSLSGDLQDGTVGDSGTYSYILGGGLQPYGAVTVTSGSLPPGATLAGSGVVTYDYTTQGSYSWVVSFTDANGNVATLADSAEIGAAFVDAWDPAETDAGGVYSNGNRTFQQTDFSIRKGAQTSTFRSSGKWYCEFVMTVGDTTNSNGDDVGMALQIFNGDAEVGSTLSGGVSVLFSGAGYYNSSVTDPYGTALTTGSVVMMAADFDTGDVWFGRNGTWFNSGNPATGTNPLITTFSGSAAPAASMGLTNGTVTVAQTSANQAYSPPAGFTPWGGS